MNRSRKLLGVLGLLPILVALAGCSPPATENITAANLVGRWELVSNGETEWFDLKADGSLTATIDRRGFIATTLSQGPQVITGGSWQLTGRTITLRLTDSSDPALNGQIHTYEILTLTDRNMETANASGEKRILLRAM